MSDLMMPRFASARPAASQANSGRLVALVRLALRTYLTRQALPDLSPRELTDIGLSASTAIAEAARLPWDVAPVPRRSTPGIRGAIQRTLERVRARRLAARLQSTNAC